MSLDRTSGLVEALRGDVSRVSLFCRGKCTEVVRNSVYEKRGLPTVPILVSAENAGLRSFVSASLILQIDALSGFSKVAKSVVGFIAVDMVNVFFRPFASHVEPNDTMKVVTASVYNDSQVSVFVDRSANRSGFPAVTASAPRKYASFRIVLKQFAQAFKSKHLAILE